jgi:ribose/xylose/arabinose/galactoside ABC-type transport system permease subunit
LRRVLVSEYFVLYLSAVYFFSMLPSTPELAHAGNLANLLSSMLPLLVVAVGQTFVLITGGIDLSVTSIMALSSVLAGSLITSDGGALSGPLAMPVGLAVMIVVGAGAGAMNGLAVSRFRMPPFIVTLAMMMLLSGAAIWFTQSKNIGGLPSSFTAIGKRIAIGFALALLVASAAHIVLSKSVYGRWFYATGQNARTAFVSGVPVAGVVFSAYVISGLCAAAAAVLYTGRLETASPVLAQRLLLDIIGAVVIGGTSLFGGKGKIQWTLFGVLFLTLVDNSLNLRGLSHFSIMMVKGAVILFAALLDSLRARLQ